MKKLGVMDNKEILNQSITLYNNHKVQKKKFIEKQFSDFVGLLDGVVQDNDVSSLRIIINETKENYIRALEECCKKNSYNMIKTLVVEGQVNPNFGIPNACKNGNLKIVKFLIEKGADNITEGINIAKANDQYHVVLYLRNILNIEEENETVYEIDENDGDDFFGLVTKFKRVKFE